MKISALVGPGIRRVCTSYSNFHAEMLAGPKSSLRWAARRTARARVGQSVRPPAFGGGSHPTDDQGPWPDGKIRLWSYRARRRGTGIVRSPCKAWRIDQSLSLGCRALRAVSNRNSLDVASGPDSGQATKQSASLIGSIECLLQSTFSLAGRGSG